MLPHGGYVSFFKSFGIRGTAAVPDSLLPFSRRLSLCYLQPDGCPEVQDTFPIAVLPRVPAAKFFFF
jgi:hypothetical protein